MRIRVGEHDGTGRKAAIFYHRLQHFPGDNRWSISLGIHPAIFAAAATAEMKLELATLVNDQLLDDARHNLNGPAELVIYDDVYPAPNGGAGNGIRNEAARRGKDIGDLGWIAQTTPAIWDTWTKVRDPDAKVPGPVKVPRPQKNGQRIPGWGRDEADGEPQDDTHCIRTILRPA